MSGELRRRPFRADLHVHSRHSGAGHFVLSGPPIGLGRVDEIYRAAKRRGMDLVTLTDLDTIAGCLEFLDRYPGADDFFISEEVTATEPRSGGRLHVLVYDITEAQHREIARLRGDLSELMTFLRSKEIIASLSLFPGESSAAARDIAGMRSLLEQFDRCEVRNGLCGAQRGRRMERLLIEAAPTRVLATTGGSGSAGPRHVGRTYTTSRANTREEFMDDLREGRTRPGGIHGSGWRAAREQIRLLAHGYRDLVAVAHPRPRGAMGAALAALPLHLTGLSLGGNAVRIARSSANLRIARRRIDRITLKRFQRKARGYARAELVAETDSGSSLRTDH